MFKQRKVLWFILVSTILGAYGGSQVRAASKAHAKSGSFFVRPSAGFDDQEWLSSIRVTGLATVIWTSGPNTADTLICPLKTTFELKFSPSPTGLGSLPRNFLGLNYDCPIWPALPPPGGSAALTLSFGHSTFAVHPIRGLRPLAFLVSGAGGRLGSVVGAKYESYTIADDPWPLYPDDLSGFPGTDFDLYVPFGIVEGLSAGTRPGLESRFEIRATYETSSGTVNLLVLDINGDQVSVTNDGLVGIQFYLIIDDEWPTTDSAKAVTMSEIQAMLASDVSGDFTVNTPLTIGIFWNDIPIPMVDLGDGSVAKIGVATTGIEINSGTSLGACANTQDGSCSDNVSQVDCLANPSSVWHEGLICSQLGACCIPGPGGPGAAQTANSADTSFADRCAINTTALECRGLGGYYQGDGTQTCLVNERGECIPTLSEWGLAAFALSVLTAGTIVVRRRW